MSHFKFLEGLQKINQEELEEVLSQYKVVEFPGSVLNISIRQGEKKIKTSRLIFHEGTRFIYLQVKKKVKFNVPQSIIELTFPKLADNKSVAPNTLCLPPTAHKINNLHKVEYLQAYTTTDLNNLTLHNFSHLVLLGQEPPEHLSGDLGISTVVHVENEKVGNWVMKHFNPNRIYITMDAARWKDFKRVQDILEDYDPEMFLIPLQKKFQEDALARMAQQNGKSESELREIHKHLMVRKMARTAIQITLASVSPNQTAPAFNFCSNLGEDLVELRILLAENVWLDSFRNQFFMSAPIFREQITKNLENIKVSYVKLKEFAEKNLVLMQMNNICFDDYAYGEGSKDCPALLRLSFKKGYLSAQLRPDHLLEDAEKIKKFRDELEAILYEIEAFHLPGCRVLRLEHFDWEIII